LTQLLFLVANQLGKVKLYVCCTKLQLNLLNLSSELQSSKEIIRILQEELRIAERVVEGRLGTQNQPRADDQTLLTVGNDHWLYVPWNKRN
jgi:hypothetical protein